MQWYFCCINENKFLMKFQWHTSNFYSLMSKSCYISIDLIHIKYWINSINLIVSTVTFFYFKFLQWYSWNKLAFHKSLLMSMSCIAIRIVYQSNRIPIRIVSIVPDRYSALPGTPVWEEIHRRFFSQLLYRYENYIYMVLSFWLDYESGNYIAIKSELYQSLCND